MPKGQKKLATSPGSSDKAAAPNPGGNFAENKLQSPRVPTAAHAGGASSQTLALRSACLEEAVDLPAGEQVKPSIAGTFDGTPAYIGAYRTDGVVHVVVVSRSGCSVLYSTSRPIR